MPSRNSKRWCALMFSFLAAAASAQDHKAHAERAPAASDEHAAPVQSVSAPAAKPEHPAAVTPARVTPAPARPGHERPPVRNASGPALKKDVRVALAETQMTNDPMPAAASAQTPVPVPPPDSAHWSYEGPTGPEAWGRLSPEFAACANGTRQSPIDIRDGMKVDLEPIAFEYRPSGFKVIDNGHTVQVNVAPGNAIRLMGRRFALVQFHFHRPSEEQLDGRFYDMVVHLVHKDAEGKLAVVAVLIEKGARQPILQAVLNNLPLEKGEEVAAQSRIDLSQLLPDNRKYFTYMGSLTTPPCTEGVLWIVMKQPVQAHGDQLDLFARLYPLNARPIQSTSGRTIKESN
jgi:carbonic anhydrase